MFFIVTFSLNLVDINWYKSNLFISMFVWNDSKKKILYHFFQEQIAHIHIPLIPNFKFCLLFLISQFFNIDGTMFF